MNRAEFETELSTQGYGEIIDRSMEVNAVNPEHAHEFDARLLVLEGEMTVTSGGEERTTAPATPSLWRRGADMPSGRDQRACDISPDGAISIGRTTNSHLA